MFNLLVKDALSKGRFSARIGTANLRELMLPHPALLLKC